MSKINVGLLITGIAMLAGVSAAYGQTKTPDRFAGTFLCDNQTISISNVDCPTLQQAGVVDSCQYFSIVSLTADGFATTAPFPRSRAFGTGLFGEWAKSNRLETSFRAINQGYSTAGVPTGFQVIESVSTWADDFSSHVGIAEIKGYDLDQDPLNPNEIPAYVGQSTNSCRRF